MEILTPTHAEQLPSALNTPGGNILRPSQMAEHYNDLRHAEADLDNPKVQDKGAVRQRVGNLKRQYESQAPRPITDGRLKDALEKEAKQLLSEILPGMLSQEEMRKNPPGSVDKHLRWERVNKPKIIRWKKIRCVQNADASDPHTWDRDAANLEQYRPQGPQDRFRADAQITGLMTYGNVPDEQWTKVFGATHPDTSALAQVQRSAQSPDQTEASLNLAPTETVLSTRVAPARKPMSEEQRKIVAANFARGREAKKQRMQEKGV